MGATPPAQNVAGAAARRPAGPGPLRALCVIGALSAGAWFLSTRGDSGLDPTVTTAGRIEVTARLLDCPEPFPDLGAYRYTYVVKYRVLQIHRQDPQGTRPLQPGDVIFVGHYKPWMPRSQIRDADCGLEVLGGRLTHLAAGDAHRMALDYELQDLAPSGVLDYGFPPGVNRFFAVWTNPTAY